MPTYLNTANHPLDLGTGAFVAPQQQVRLKEPNDTVAEHLASGRLVELQTARKSAPKQEEEA